MGIIRSWDITSESEKSRLTTDLSNFDDIKVPLVNLKIFPKKTSWTMGHPRIKGACLSRCQILYSQDMYPTTKMLSILLTLTLTALPYSGLRENASLQDILPSRTGLQETVMISCLLFQDGRNTHVRNFTVRIVNRRKIIWHVRFSTQY